MASRDCLGSQLQSCVGMIRKKHLYYLNHSTWIRIVYAEMYRENKFAVGNARLRGSSVSGTCDRNQGIKSTMRKILLSQCYHPVATQSVCQSLPSAVSIDETGMANGDHFERIGLIHVSRVCESIDLRRSVILPYK